ncbi:MAG: hypothetical protein ACYC2R_12275 [Burkholderiales bacterium]
MKKRMFGGLLAVSFFLAAQAGAAGEDARVKVEFPAMMKTHMLGNMRDHLRALHEIQAALAKGELDKAGDIAETRIGMSSLPAHNAAHMAPYMPEGMQAIGTEMHHAASRFAVVVKEGDLSRSLGALSKITEQCIACHAAYRVN